MILKIAWRNIWRHKIRSIVVILSIAVGLWAGVFMVGFSWGIYRQYIRESVETQISHLQIHHPKFESEDNDPRYMIANGNNLLSYINSIPSLKAFAARVIASGMISSPTTASGVNIFGIDPEKENKLTGFASNTIEGKYLDSTGKYPILIGSKLARKLHVRLKSKIVLTFQDADGNIVAGAFRIAGIYRSRNSTLDETQVYVRANDLNHLLNTENAIYEIAILLQNDENVEPVKAVLKNKFKGLDIKTWKEISPELELIIESFSQFMYIFVGFILLALTFGIVNTMLMAVLERTREIGILMAIGMNRWKVFVMVMLESICLALVGGPLGLIIGYLTILWTGKSGIDLSVFSEGLGAYGFSTTVYPHLEVAYYLPLSLMTIFTAILSAIYPSIRAIRLKPVEAIRKI